MESSRSSSKPPKCTSHLGIGLARWAARIGLGQQIVTTKTLRRRFFSIAGRLTRSARRPPCIFPSAGPGKPSSLAPWPDCGPFPFQPDGAVDGRPTLQTIEHPRKLAPVRARECLSLPGSPANLTQRRHCGSPLERRTTAAGRHRPHLLGPNLNHRVPTPIIPRLASITTPLRWIRAK